ncbi:MAG: chromosome segregation protein SMC [Deltaproteobacteria bacterium]
MENASLLDEKRTVTAQLSQASESFQKFKERSIRLQQHLEAEKASLMDLVAQEARYKNTYQNASNNKENLKRRQKRIDQDIAIASKESAGCRRNLSRINEALELIQQQQSDLNSRTHRIEEKLNRKIASLSQQVKESQRIELERNQIRSQHTALKKMAESYAWYRDGVKSIMKVRQEPAEAGHENLSRSIIGLMADILEPEPNYETAVEAVLGESLQYILVKEQQAGIQAVDYLQQTGTGRGGFIPINAAKPLASYGVKMPEPSDLLLNHISVKEGFQHIAAALLGHVAVADTLADALTLFNANGKLQTIVTKDGNVVSHQGLLIGGSKEKLSGILSKKQELKQLARQAKALDKTLEAAKETQQAMESGLRQLETDLQKHLEEKSNLAQEGLETEKSAFKASEALKQAQRHFEILQLESEQLTGEESDIEEEIHKYNHAIADIEAKVQTAQQSVSQTTEKIEAVSREMDRSNQTIVDYRLKLTSLTASIENSDHTLKRLQDFYQDGLKRLDQLSKEIVDKKQKRASLQEKVERFEKQLLDLYQQLKMLDEQLKENEAHFVAIDEELQQNDTLISDIQNEREQTLQKIRLLEIEQSQQTMKRENIANRLEERFHISVNALRQRYQDETSTHEVDIRELEADLEKYKNKMARLGDVNMSAIDEFETLKTRYDFLTAQREDLEKAIEDLHSVIKKINRITQERFTKTFDAVNQKLSEVFPRLFEGGTASLVLTEPNNPLETGVEYMIHPPGKKLTRMSLLSGGEKALSAIAFIFSIFLIKPTSFCLMDEIDAPLDDANVFRFNDLLKVIGEKSQIIMVTHNKRTMEFADTLFGITMGEKGVSKVVTVNFDRQSN